MDERKCFLHLSGSINVRGTDRHGLVVMLYDSIVIKNA